MEIGAFFILLIVLVVVAVLAAVVLAIGSALRRRKLDPEGDRVEASAGGRDEPQQRPEHVRVATEQHSRFIAH